MLYYYLLFFFLTVIAKLILAVITIYLLLPTDTRCSRCDEETLLLIPSRARRIGGGLFLGRAQWRWCPRCGWEGMARRGERASEVPGVASDRAAHIRH